MDKNGENRTHGAKRDVEEDSGKRVITKTLDDQ